MVLGSLGILESMIQSNDLVCVHNHVLLIFAGNNAQTCQFYCSEAKLVICCFCGFLLLFQRKSVEYTTF